MLGGYDTTFSIQGVGLAAEHKDTTGALTGRLHAPLHYVAHGPRGSVTSWKPHQLKMSFNPSRSKTGYSTSTLPVPTPQIHHQTLLKLADATTQELQEP